MKGIRLVAFVLLMLLVVGSGIAAADQDEPTSESKPALEGHGEDELDPTDPQAAEELPHHDLARGEAIELLQATFGSQLQRPAGPFDDLDVEEFLSEHAAILASSSAQETSAPGPVLLESTLPLRTEDAEGEEAPVDLSLQATGGALRPANPLVGVSIPQNLDEGVALPELGIRIQLDQAPAERSPSTVEQSVAAYPEVDTDTSFAVAPTPTGVETLTMLQAPDAPMTQHFTLQLPPGAALEGSEDGGALVSQSGNGLLSIAPPSAIDARGEAVAVTMTVEGDSIALQAHPTSSTAYPILLDPVYNTYSWYSGKTTAGLSDWSSSSNTSVYVPSTSSLCRWDTCSQTELPNGTPGLFIEAGPETVAAGGEARWDYFVPRYASDFATYGSRPSSFIANLTLQNLDFFGGIDRNPSPYLFAGIWDSTASKWTTGAAYLHGGQENNLSNATVAISGNGDQNAKNARIGLTETETHALFEKEPAHRALYLGGATIELSDGAAPSLESVVAPSQWMNAKGLPIGFAITDTGLGAKSIEVGGSESKGTATLSCSGTVSSPCPRVWKSGEAGRPALEYETIGMPQGIRTAQLVASDALGNKSTPVNVQLKVDHTAPKLALSGTMTEQGTLGLGQPSYTLKTVSTDGGQAGAISYASSFGAGGTGNGQFTHPAGIAIDAKGNLLVVDENNKRVEKFSEAGAYVSKFGSAGTGDGQFGRPTDVAIDSKGRLWVTDASNNRIEEFTEAGEFIAKFGTAGSGNLQFSGPESIAISPKGNIFIGDTYNHRVQELNEKGEFLRAFGSLGSGEGQIVESTGIAVSPAGNVYVADWGNNRISEFSEAGVFIRQFGKEGIASGEFKRPDVIEADAAGHIFVGDQNNERVQEFGEAGEYLAKFGTAGAGAGQFSFGWPMGIAIGAKGDIWVSDTGNNRVQRWTQPLDNQSGVVSAKIEVDGQVVDSSAPGCPTQNCSIAREWTLNSSAFEPGAHVITVSATDGVGLTSSQILKIVLAKSPAVMVSPDEGERTGARLKLIAGWKEGSPAPSGVTFQAKAPGAGAFQAISPTYVQDAKHQNVNWPYSLSGATKTPPLYFNALGQLGAEGGAIEVRAFLSGPASISGYTDPVKVTVDPTIGGPRDASVPLGPGNLDPITGNLNITRTDVAIPGFGSALEFSRSHNSLQPGASADTSVLGRGWKAGAPVEAAGGAAWRSVREVSASAEEREEGYGDYVLLTDLEGYEYAFESEGGTYVSPPEFTGWALTHSGSTFTLADPDGNATTFESIAGTSEYQPASITQAGGPGNATKMIYKLVEGKPRLSIVIAPRAPGMSCPATEEATTSLGCRSLTFSYLPVSNWGAPASYKERLSSITF
ncbi:MAG: 6-bladed beta-propeller, partial [Thermoleophilia bacterium]